jgi:hypothetical protein
MRTPAVLSALLAPVTSRSATGVGGYAVDFDLDGSLLL